MHGNRQPKVHRVGVVAQVVLAAAALAAAAGPLAASDDWWGGVGLGLSFGGDVDYLSVEPVIGYWINEKVTVGGRGIIRFRDDDRYADSESQTDYGLAAFSRYFPAQRFFIQGEYEWISYERPFFAGSTNRDDYDSLWFGGGYAQPLSSNSWFSLVALYNLTWDEDEPSPYDDPWVIRGGLGWRF